jgi:hypothetical protein
MAVTYTAAAKTARMQAIGDLIGNAGKIKGYTSGDVLVATWTLPSPSAPAASNGVLTFDVNPDINATLATPGTIAKATIATSADTVVLSGLTVGLTGSGADIVMSNNVVASTGDTVTLQTATLTHA